MSKMQMVSPSQEVLDVLLSEGDETFRSCYQCSLCTAMCPWNRVNDFSIRLLIHEAQLGLTDFEDEGLWNCVGCRMCVQRCPRGVQIIDVVRALRRTVIEVGAGAVPRSLRVAIKNVLGAGNPLGEAAGERAKLMKELGAPPFTKETEILYFPCCYQLYDSSIRKVALATVNIFKKLGVNFGVMNSGLVCCGESIRKAGAESVFQSVARANISAFDEAGVRKIVVTSPHCYQTFTNEYPGFGGKYEVVHLVQYLADLINDGRIQFTGSMNKKVTYHDPCGLGRYADIYIEPRQVLQSISGVELVEMPEAREDSLCCGGGAGRLWMETKKGERFSDLRIEQAIGTGAVILATACPYCMLNFQDSVLTSDKGDIIEVKDVAELVQEAL